MNDSTAKTERLSLAVSQAERGRIMKLAALHGLSVSEYIRMRAISDPIERVS